MDDTDSKLVNTYYNVWFAHAGYNIGDYKQLCRVVKVDGANMLLQCSPEGAAPYSYWSDSTLDINCWAVVPLTIHIHSTGVQLSPDGELYGSTMTELMESSLEKIAVAIIAPKEGYEIQFLQTDEALWIENDELYYVIRVNTPNGKHMYLDLKVPQMSPPIDLDKMYRETKLKRPPPDDVDSIRSWVKADIKLN